jgi:hypothetical protein
MTRRLPEQWATGFNLSFVVMTIVSSVLVIVKETNAGVKDWMKEAFTHHWIAQGVLILVPFVILGLLFAYTDLGRRIDYKRQFWAVVGATAIGSLLLVALFATHVL